MASKLPFGEDGIAINYLEIPYDGKEPNNWIAITFLSPRISYGGIKFRNFIRTYQELSQDCQSSNK